MWTVPKFADDSPDFDSFEPERVLDFYDCPMLFTVRDREQRQFLVYKCGQDDSVERFLVVPTGARHLADLEQGRISLRRALVDQAWAWLIDIDREGKLSSPGLIDPMTLPEDALPRAEAFLGP